MIKKFFKTRKLTKEAFLVAGFLIFWLVWLVAPRNSYPYYWAIGVPFGAILLAKFLVEKAKKYSWEVASIVLASGTLFAFFYPLMTNIAVKTWYLRLLTGISGAQ